MKLRTALLGAAAAVAFAPAAFAERGADGNVKILYSQAVSIMNAYLSSGTKDVEVGSLVLEPLAGFDQEGNVFPRLADGIPTVENGQIAEDYTSITWKLKPGLLWSDGTPFTADDVVFTAEYCMHPEGGCAQAARYEGVASVGRDLARAAKGAIRQLPWRGGPHLHGCEFQAAWHWPFPRRRLQGERHGRA